MDSNYLLTHVGNPPPKPNPTLSQPAAVEHEWPLHTQRPAQPRSGSGIYRRTRSGHAPLTEKTPGSSQGGPDHSPVAHDLSQKQPKPEQDGEFTQPALRRRLWSPIWLHPAVLFGFSFSFLSMICVIIALYVVSEKNQGLSSETNAYRYLW